MDVKGKRIFVGLSGGVDSAVSAALLKEAGADVIGVFIKGWYPPGMPCTWAAERRDAMRVAARLRIPFHTLDASKDYKQGVIDYLIREYAEGRTPNPDVMCNREVKFGAFWRFAEANGADGIATGHYARLEDGRLMRGHDGAKDQSYFLWAVPKEALARTWFPVGGLPKAATRARAKRFKLPVATKRDSQGICFLGSVSVDDFLRSELHPVPGDALDTSGAKIGTHDGAVLATLGQRVALTNAPQGPWYVVRKDLAANTLTVAHEPVRDGSREAIPLTETNWLSEPSAGILHAQYRYHGPLVEGTLSEGHRAFLPSAPLPEALAAGQSLVLYDGDRLVGGGIISSSDS